MTIQQRLEGEVARLRRELAEAQESRRRADEARAKAMQERDVQRGLVKAMEDGNAELVRERDDARATIAAIATALGAYPDSSLVDLAASCCRGSDAATEAHDVLTEAGFSGLDVAAQARTAVAEVERLRSAKEQDFDACRDEVQWSFAANPTMSIGASGRKIVAFGKWGHNRVIAELSASDGGRFGEFLKAVRTEWLAEVEHWMTAAKNELSMRRVAESELFSLRSRLARVEGELIAMIDDRVAGECGCWCDRCQEIVAKARAAFAAEPAPQTEPRKLCGTCRHFRSCDRSDECPADREYVTTQTVACERHQTDTRDESEARDALGMGVTTP